MIDLHRLEQLCMDAHQIEKLARSLGATAPEVELARGCLQLIAIARAARKLRDAIERVADYDEATRVGVAMNAFDELLSNITDSASDTEAAARAAVGDVSHRELARRFLRLPFVTRALIVRELLGDFDFGKGHHEEMAAYRRAFHQIRDKELLPRLIEAVEAAGDET